MKIVYGLSSGMVLQRDTELCRAGFAADAVGDVNIRVSVPHGQVREDAPRDGHRFFWLINIPVGGPYTVTLTDDESSVTLTDLYVGDVWLLAGQSNMEGIGYYRDIAGELRQRPELRQFSLDNEHWELAEPRLHRGWMCPEPFMQNHFKGHGGVHVRGVGPGFYFAEAMHARTGLPQGVIPCALGGSNLSQWDPDAKEDIPNLYQITMNRIKLSGGRVRGIFWYQGCAEANPTGVELFTGRMQRLIAAFREALGEPELPFVQVQIGRFSNAAIADDPHWSAIRELQRQMTDAIPALDTLAVTDADYADGIHLQARYHQRLGKAAAESMARLCFDKQGLKTLPAPALSDIRIIHGSDDWGENLAVRYRNIHGGLQSPGVPSGFALSRSPDHIDTRSIFRLELGEDTVFVRHECPDEQLKEMYLSYFFGNGTYANITDAAGRPLPAFGPLKLSDWLK